MKIRRSTIVVVVFLILLTACGCTAPPHDGGGKMGVAVSILPLAEFVERVGGDKVNVKVLIPSGASSHTYEPKPSEMVDAAGAQIFFKVGVGLEAFEDKLIQVNSNLSVVDTSAGLSLLEGSSEHDGALEYDPHVWLSVRNAGKMVENICSALSAADPENSDYYVQNREDYIAELDILDAELQASTSSMTVKKFIVFHPAWSYFARDYGLEQIAIEVEGKEPGPKDIMEVVETAKQNNIKVIFASPQFSTKTAEVISREIGGGVILIDPLEKNYTANMRYVAAEMSKASGEAQHE